MYIFTDVIDRENCRCGAMVSCSVISILVNCQKCPLIPCFYRAVLIYTIKKNQRNSDFHLPPIIRVWIIIYGSIYDKFPRWRKRSACAKYANIIRSLVWGSLFLLIVINHSLLNAKHASFSTNSAEHVEALLCINCNSNQSKAQSINPPWTRIMW